MISSTVRLSWPGSPPEWLPPGRPVPGRPDGPGRPPAPSPGPGADQPPALSPWLEQRMFEQQVVALAGPITDESASRAASALMTLEALVGRRGSPIRLQISSPDGALSAAFALVDVLDAMRSPVQAIALGTVGGAALAVYCAAPERVAYPHARFLLAEPRVDKLAGTADEVTRAAGAQLRLLDDLVVRLADVTGRPRAGIERDLSERRNLSVEEAIEYGLVHKLAESPPAQ
jgi:ATP-dependent Clp protease, protease subunit